jgi:cytochrome c biogenesis protein CcdA/thiol-disulfide isomerase/thioredoxin
MTLLLAFAFLSGLVTILAPCIWPVLPIVLSSSVAGKGNKRPLGITLGIIISFAFLTLTISALVKIFNINLNILRIIAVVIIGFLGLTMIFPKLYERLEILVTKLGNSSGIKQTKEGNGFWPGFLTGLSLGVVWTPCAGPILATIALLAATGKINLDAVLVTIFYVVGVGVPLFIFAYGGQRIITNLRGVSKYTGRIQRIFGAVMILAAVAIFTNFDQTLQLTLLNNFPILGTTVNGFENSSLVTNQLNILKGQGPIPVQESAGLFNANIPAPDFVGITNWLNTPKPLSIKDLKGKVVLVDFWTYTCINCIRTLPHVTAWYNKYKNDGFVVVGVHTPEFQFEHDTNNVEAAIKMFNITYPVAQDNNYATWNAYNNEYWPAEYLIDANGQIRRTDFGEGQYDQTELAIQTLLKNAGQNVNTALTNVPNQTPTGAISPETYLGTARMEFYFPNGSVSNGDQTFTLSNNLSPNSFSFGGEWNESSANATTGKNAELNYNFTANDVYLVMNPDTANPAKVMVFIDGSPANTTNEGSDVINGVVTINSDRLYNLVNLKGNARSHILRLEFESAGIELFAFTFG